MRKIKLIVVLVILVSVVSQLIIGIKKGNDIDLRDIEPGDIIVGCSITPIPGYWDHAAMYIGNGEIIEGLFGGVMVFGIEEVYKKNHVVLLRVNTTDDIKEKAVEFVKSKIEYPFKWIWIDKQQGNSYYCSELIWAAYYNASNGTVNLDSYDPPIPDPIFPDELVRSEHIEEIAREGTPCYFSPIIEVFLYSFVTFDYLFDKL